jgi:hypothetical protein
MRQVAMEKKPEMFVTALGIRANKLEVIHENGSVKVKPKQWLNKKAWHEINDILRIHEFKGTVERVVGPKILIMK